MPIQTFSNFAWSDFQDFQTEFATNSWSVGLGVQWDHFEVARPQGAGARDPRTHGTQRPRTQGPRLGVSTGVRPLGAHEGRS